jgi:hypothetical protein
VSIVIFGVEGSYERKLRLRVKLNVENTRRVE